MPNPSSAATDHCRRPQRAGQPRQGRGLGHRRRAARQISPQGQVLFGRRRRIRLLRRRVRLGHDGRHLRQHDAHRLAQGLSRRAREDRPRHATAPCPGTTACRSSSANSSGRRSGKEVPLPICPRQVLKRVLEARREARLHGDVRDGIRVVQLRRDAAIVGRQEGVGPTTITPGHVRLLAAARQREPRILRGADDRDGRLRRADRRPAHRDRPRRLRGGDPVFRSARSRPTARSCSRPAPRRSARASASCRASWPSGTSISRAARATSTSRCPTARRTSSTIAKGRQRHEQAVRELSRRAGRRR